MFIPNINSYRNTYFLLYVNDYRCTFNLFIYTIMKSILLIVDPQNDFITGTLAVPGAKENMMKLSDYIRDFGHEYDYICITMDTHPVNHCSFKENGGIWPKHCVNFTNGWEMPEYLKESLAGRYNIYMYHKGTEMNSEEYSIFSNQDGGQALTNLLFTTQAEDPETFVDVCGIAGDYCVLETVKSLKTIINPDHIGVLIDLVASIDGGEKLIEFLDDNGLEYFNAGSFEH